MPDNVGEVSLMLVIYALLLLVLGASAFLGAGLVWFYMASSEFRGPRTIICPETRQPAEVEVDGAYAARTAFAGHEELRVTACARWPEKQGCDQACTPQIPLAGDDRRLTRYAPFGLQPWQLRRHHPVRMSESLYAAHAAEFAREHARHRSA
jgi:hypothetical protein